MLIMFVFIYFISGVDCKIHPCYNVYTFVHSSCICIILFLKTHQAPPHQSRTVFVIEIYFVTETYFVYFHNCIASIILEDCTDMEILSQ